MKHSHSKFMFTLLRHGQSLTDIEAIESERHRDES